MPPTRLGSATRALFWAMLVLCSAPSTWADGLVLVPPQALHLYSEQYQGAVVSVNADRTADVDLFISLATSSPRPQQVHFLLPLQTVPTRFVAREQTQQQFTDQKLNPLDRVLDEGAAEAAATETSVEANYKGWSFLLGPWALVSAIWSAKASTASPPAGQSIAPVLSAATEHAQADVYPSLRPDQLAALAGLPDLPESVRQTVKAYAGHPFALVRLRLIPVGPEAGKREPGEEPASPPGVLFSFKQQLLPDRAQSRYSYDFPLGTGQAWANPIAATFIYVTAPEDLNLRVRFPDRPLEKEGWARDRESLHHFARGAAAREQSRQVYAAAYSPDDGGGNPSEDIPVELRTGGVSELVARREAAQRRADLLSPIFPVLALLTWVAACDLFLPWGEDRGVASRLAAVVGYWLAAQLIQVVLFLPVVVIGALLSFGLDRRAAELSSYLPLALLSLGAVWWGRREPGPRFRNALHRVPLAALFSSLVYFSIGFMIWKL